MTSNDPAGKTQKQIQDWVVDKVAEWLEIPSEEVDPQEPFADYGLGSVAAVSISGDLEAWLGCRLAPTLLWDHPTIERLAEYLAENN